MESLIHKVLYLVLATTYSEGNKKYDIEKEAQLTYGKNINGVLSKFRRTPDYLKILEQKRDQIKEEYQDIALLTHAFYSNKLTSRIQKIIGIDLKAALATDATTTTTTTRGLLFRRQARNRSEEARQARINRIDKYYKLASPLSLQERNEFKNVGFQYIGDCLHAIIENMGAEMGPRDKHTTTPIRITMTTLAPTSKEEDRQKEEEEKRKKEEEEERKEEEEEEKRKKEEGRKEEEEEEKRDKEEKEQEEKREKEKKEEKGEEKEEIEDEDEIVKNQIDKLWSADKGRTEIPSLLRVRHIKG